MKWITTTLMLVGVAMGLFGQEYLKVRGSIADHTTKEPVLFANIGVKGAFIGTTSNFDGEFEVKIPVQYTDSTLVVSCIGYTSVSYNIGKVAKLNSLEVILVPQSYKINTIDVNAKSLVNHQRIKKAVRLLPQNFLQKPYNYNTYYRCEIHENDSLTRLREAAVKTYDKNGYLRQPIYQAFKDRTYQFVQVRKNFESSTLIDGSTNLDDLLEMDLVRTTGNVLDTTKLDSYELKLEMITEYDGDSVWVIAYTNTKPNLASTGDAYVSSYTGKLYISQKSYAVVKNETQVVAGNYSPMGRSYYVNESKQTWKPDSVKYDFTVIYKKHDDAYYLSYIAYNRYLESTHRDTGEKRKKSINTELMVNNIEVAQPEPIDKRAYYEDTPYDADFWNSYNILLDKK